MVYIQLGVAIVASFVAWGMAEEFYNILNCRIVPEHPSGRNRAVVCRVNQSQCICQFARVLPDQRLKIGMVAYFSIVEASCQFRQSFSAVSCVYHAEESFKFFLFFQQ